MEARVASKELLGLEQEKPSFLESNFLVRKKKEQMGKATRMKSKNKKKRDGVLGKEESKNITTAAIPISPVLGKVKDFLGVIAGANEKLHSSAQGNGSKHDIEVLTGNETEYIEMDLLLGVTDLQTPEAVAVAEAAVAGSSQYLSLFDDYSSSESEENGDEENDCTTENPSLSHGKVPNSDSDGSSSAIQSRKRPKITVLN